MAHHKIEPKPSGPANSLSTVVKQMALVVSISAIVVLVLYSFFLPQLAQGRLDQLLTQGKSQSVLVSQMALNAVYSRNQKELNQQLARYQVEVIKDADQFMQISVILYPSGFYYSSTTPAFVGQKSHSTLLTQLESTPLEAVSSSIMPYQINGQVKQVFQFLKAVNISKEDQLIRIATIQVLIGFEDILQETGELIFLHAAWITLCFLILVWLVNQPVSRCYKRLALGMSQVSAGHLDHEMPKASGDEAGQLYQAFNHMTKALKAHRSTSLSRKSASEEHSRGNEISLRKANLTCLCARIPQMQDWINSEKPDHTAKLIQQYLGGLETVIAENGGQVIKILGNKVYTLFEGINGINNSLRAAVKLSKTWSEDNHQRKVLGQPQLHYGLGLHAASGLAGTLGVKSDSYTFIGEAASAAEYLCSCAGASEALATQSTLERASISLQQNPHDELRSSSLRVLEEVFSITEIVATESVSKASPFTVSNEDYQSSLSLDNMPGMLEETLMAAPLDLNLKEEPPLEDWKTEDLEATSKASFWDEAQQVENGGLGHAAGEEDDEFDNPI